MRLITALALTAALLPSCITIDVPRSTPSPAVFVTSTLAPPPFQVPLGTIPPATATGHAAPDGTPASTCRPSAVLLEDVTIPDDTRMSPGHAFVKTWRFRNTGACAWEGFSIAFIAGDRMGAAETLTVPSTAPGASVDISVNMSAPSSEGVYTGYFELRDAAGTVVPIGANASFWVRILVGNATAPAPPPGTPAAAPLYTPGGPLSCDYDRSAAYLTEIAGLINNARLSAGLARLTIDARLAAAALDHSIDMACFGLKSHSGSDGSSPYERVTAAGYTGFLEEIIYASGFPQDAFDWWMNDPPHRDAILNPRARAMGVGYAYVETSLYGGYYTVDFGSQ